MTRKATMAETPLVLSDNDDTPDTWAWVSVAYGGATEAEAFAQLTDEFPIPEGEPLRYEPRGKVWLAPLKDDLDDEWRPVSPADEGAMEFWKFEVGDA